MSDNDRSPWKMRQRMDMTQKFDSDGIVANPNHPSHSRDGSGGGGRPRMRRFEIIKQGEVVGWLTTPVDKDGNILYRETIPFDDLRPDGVWP